ncbi:hypothetical protein [Streptomyces sp.]|uniref:hypothetical protein n=1 Tax=Streptomyces sp. TaxID=1931 RepID=UPI0028116D0D|nr:hypothetical protein [Streptomyces sp.]
MDVSLLRGPGPRRGVGVVAPFGFALDRELWRRVPYGLCLRVTRTPYGPVEVSDDLARLVSEHETLCEAMGRAGAVPAITTSGALLEALAELDVRRVAPVTPYTVISANQVTMWAALRRLGTRAVGPYQAPVDPAARSGPVPPGADPGPVVPEEEQQQEGWT